MLDLSNIPDIEAKELLARYVFSRSHFSRQNQRVKADAFMPPPNLEMSMTRHRDATEAEIWAVGRHIADQREQTLYCRGDAIAATFELQRLSVVPDPLEENPNHANVVGWPVDDKPSQKLIAQEIAANAQFVALPEVS